MAAKMIDRPVKAKTLNVNESKEAMDWVIQELGSPPNLLRVEAKHLWGDYYRVNVYTATDVGMNAKEIAVSDSFFVYRSSEGFLSDPPVARKYNVA